MILTILTWLGTILSLISLAITIYQEIRIQADRTAIENDEAFLRNAEKGRVLL